MELQGVVAFRGVETIAMTVSSSALFLGPSAGKG